MWRHLLPEKKMKNDLNLIMTLEFFFAPWKKIVPLSNEMFETHKQYLLKCIEFQSQFVCSKNDLYRLDFMAI